MNLVTQQLLDALNRPGQTPKDELVALAEEAHAQADNLLACFWTLIMGAEQEVLDTRDPVLRIQVEGYFRVWTTMTGLERKPRWLERREQPT